VIHPHTELRLVDPLIGQGVFATHFIPRGTLTWTLCRLDQVYTQQQIEDLPAAYQPIVDTYAYINADNTWVLCWDWGRSMNHSCAPNTLGLADSIDVAVRDIHPGEQLTCEYGMLNLTTHMDWRCGAPGCRQQIGPDDVLRYGEAWDAVVAQVLPWVGQVEQPLRPFVQDLALLEQVAWGQVAASPSRSYYRNSQAQSQ
jgi:hypothetical protein